MRTNLSKLSELSDIFVVDALYKGVPVRLFT